MTITPTATVSVASSSTAEIPVWASREGFGALALILPSGRTAPQPPKAAVDLVDAARAAGWTTLLQWGEDTSGDPFLIVELRMAEPFHHYRVSWHSRGRLDRVPVGQEYVRDVSEARLRLFSKSLTTRDRRGHTVEVPSLKAIRQTIADHLTESGSANGRYAALAPPLTSRERPSDDA